jgi:hypothetical protein
MPPWLTLSKELKPLRASLGARGLEELKSPGKGILAHPFPSIHLSPKGALIMSVGTTANNPQHQP